MRKYSPRRSLRSKCDLVANLCSGNTIRCQGCVVRRPISAIVAESRHQPITGMVLHSLWGSPILTGSSLRGVSRTVTIDRPNQLRSIPLNIVLSLSLSLSLWRYGTVRSSVLGRASLVFEPRTYATKTIEKLLRSCDTRASQLHDTKAIGKFLYHRGQVQGPQN